MNAALMAAIIASRPVHLPLTPDSFLFAVGLILGGAVGLVLVLLYMMGD
jgi:hypothetical protein